MDAYVPASRAIFASEVQKSGCNICVAVGNCRGPASRREIHDLLRRCSRKPLAIYAVSAGRFGVAIAKMGRKNRDLERSSGLTIACSRADKISAALARENFTIVRHQAEKKKQMHQCRCWSEGIGSK